ncbi:MAG: hypothetical protein V2B15_02215 [Bacteroidota bacterium]
MKADPGGEQVHPKEEPEPGSPSGRIEGEDLDPDLIVKAWQDYASSVEKSKPRVYSTLQNNRPVVKADGTILVLLNSEAQRENFIKNVKPDLSRFICRAAGLELVEIQTDVVEMEKNGKKIYTDQDKLDFLIKKNPALGQLKSRFALDFDD